MYCSNFAVVLITRRTVFAKAYLYFIYCCMCVCYASYAARCVSDFLDGFEKLCHNSACLTATRTSRDADVFLTDNSLFLLFIQYHPLTTTQQLLVCMVGLNVPKLHALRLTERIWLFQIFSQWPAPNPWRFLGLQS